MNLRCKDSSVFEAKKKPVNVYGFWVKYPLEQTCFIHYCVWGKEAVYKTVVIDGKKTDLHKQPLESQTLALQREDVLKYFEVESYD